MKRVPLSAEDREFFAVLSNAIVMNPFSEGRSELLQELGALDPSEAWDLDTGAYGLVTEVNRRIEKLERAGANTLAHFPPEDRSMIERIFLYQIYHSLVPDLDGHIVEELRAPQSKKSVPFAPRALEAMVRRGIEEDAASRYFAYAYQLRRAFHFIVDLLVGGSDSIRQLRLKLWNCVFTYDLRNYESMFIERMEDFSTLLLGETGTGKGQAAAAIGRSGFIPFDPRTNEFVAGFDDVFNSTNLTRFTESLIESELFGHCKGAFTGAISDHQGLLERCSPYGSLFLDEIGDASVHVQIKLLEVLHNRTFTPVGSQQVHKFAGRVIAATNRPLAELRRGGKFRDDFFYRLSSDVVHVPTLRQRITESPGELELLVTRIIARMVEGESAEIVDRVLENLCKRLPPGYAWPGNVRELEQAIRSILMTGEYKPESFSDSMAPEAVLAQQFLQGAVTAEKLLTSYCALLYRQIGTYEGVAHRVGLDRRTVKSYVEKDEHSNEKN